MPTLLTRRHHPFLGEDCPWRAGDTAWPGHGVGTGDAASWMPAHHGQHGDGVMQVSPGHVSPCAHQLGAAPVQDMAQGAHWGIYPLLGHIWCGAPRHAPCCAHSCLSSHRDGRRATGLCLMSWTPQGFQCLGSPTGSHCLGCSAWGPGAWVWTSPRHTALSQPDPTGTCHYTPSHPCRREICSLHCGSH